VRVIVTRPSCWGSKFKSNTLDIRYVPIGFPDRRLRKGEPAADNMGEVMTGEGEKLLIKAFAEHKPRVFLFWPHFGNFTPKLLKRLKKSNPKTEFVHGNGNHVLGPHSVCWYIHKYRRFIDAVLTSTTDGPRKALIAKWCKWVGTLYTFGFDPDLFTAPEKDPDYDVFFGGGDSVRPRRVNGRFKYSRFRHDLVMEIAKHRKILIRGGGTWKHHGVPFKPGVMDSLPYFREIQRAKIVLGTYHDNLERRYSKRTVYGGASGRLFMTRYIPKMEEDFKNHENIVWFRSVDEGLELIDHYMSHDDEREKVAARTRAHFVANHDWAARLRDFERVVPVMMRALASGAGKGKGAGCKR